MIGLENAPSCFVENMLPIPFIWPRQIFCRKQNGCNKIRRNNLEIVRIEAGYLESCELSLLEQFCKNWKVLLFTIFNNSTNGSANDLVINMQLIIPIIDRTILTHRSRAIYQFINFLTIENTPVLKEIVRKLFDNRRELENYLCYDRPIT